MGGETRSEHVDHVSQLVLLADRTGLAGALATVVGVASQHRLGVTDQVAGEDAVAKRREGALPNQSVVDIGGTRIRHQSPGCRSDGHAPL